MESRGKRNLFVTVVCILLMMIIAMSAYATINGPLVPNSKAPTQVVEGGNVPEGKLLVKDLNDGELTIPKYNVPVNQYDPDLFSQEDGVMTYNDKSVLGINVTEKDGEIDWEKVASSGVKFAYIRVGFRGKGRGDMYLDARFQENVDGAQAAGLDIGVYYYSGAISAVEAEEEATQVLERVQGMQMIYPISFNWEYTTTMEDGTQPRTLNSTPTEVTSFAKAFCSKVAQTGRPVAFYTNKTMAYDYFNLDELKDYDIWYQEYRTTPAFYYNFAIWQYTKEAQIPGIERPVKMSLALKAYS